jgi:protein-S-isoprenylcysteine O-methyltransferase Ste14
MELFPEFELTALGGWLSLLPMVLIQSVNIFSSSPEARTRLFDRSKHTSDQRMLLLISKTTSLLVLILLIFTPLSSEIVEVITGFFIIIIGCVGVRMAVLNFINTPINQPVTKGLYKYSRNPQEVMLSLIFIGGCITIGSWLALLALGLSRILNHFSILAQEQACIQQYGESYEEYMNSIPRYFLFF